MDVVHVKGSANLIADALSRRGGPELPQVTGQSDPAQEEALRRQHEDAGHPALQVPPDTQDPAPQGGHTVLRGSGARMGSVSDQDTPHPLWSWPGAVSLEPGSGELTTPGGQARPPSPSLSREPGPPAQPLASKEGWGGGRSIWWRAPMEGEGPEERGLPGSRTQGGAHETGRIWLEEQREPRGNPCLKAEKEAGTVGASPMEEGGLGGSNTQWGPGASSLWPGEERGWEGLPGGSSQAEEGEGQSEGDFGRGSLWLGVQGGSQELGGPIGVCKEGDEGVGFGLAHPNMMAELKFRLRRPPPQ
ncbi:uncharacterized protein LOC142046694 [Chelonoidis abingdonii]|uniref:uncharacterized protein LOC142046694 n=1 Tax=Chelonoidis abingdonii TaxID=106734 RepID=UPI003F496B1C